MSPEELNTIIAQLKNGKIFYQEDRAYAYSGDIYVQVIRYCAIQDCLLWETYDLTPVRDFCSRSEIIPNEKLPQLIGSNFEEAMAKLTDKKSYPFIP